MTERPGRSQPETQPLRVGEVARRTGITVRTLHHYDDLGLLEPERTASGYRLYGRAELARLQQIVSLRQIGLGLEEIREVLDRPETTLASVLDLHVDRLRQSIGREQRLLARLESLAERHRRSDQGAPEIALDDLLETLEMTTMFEKHYTKEQLETLEARKAELGDETIASVQNEWPELIAAVRAEMEKGTDPSDPTVQRLARRWGELVALFTGGDPGISRSLGNVMREEPRARQKAGIDPELMAYVGRAREAGEG